MPRKRLKRKVYSDQALAQALSLHAIARKHHVAPMLVCDIRRGRKRPDLTARIDELRRGIRIKGCLLVGSWIKDLLRKHQEAGQGEGENARLCREYLIDRFLLHKNPSQAAATAKQAARRRQ